MRKHSYSCSLITQGQFKMYSATIPSDVLAKCCFVTTREENQADGFQRLLDKKRALSIASYIDNELGTIPSAVILSAQEDSGFVYDSKNKVIKFNDSPNSFLVLDGQHRIYGYSLANSSLRVPVVIYSELKRRDETRLFIDINTTQKEVPSELLLDIKKLAEYESSAEEELREIFDWFHKDKESSLYGLTAPSKRSSNKISRVTFNSAVKPLLKMFANKNNEQITSILNSYYSAILTSLDEKGIRSTFTTSVVFRAFNMSFKSVIKKHKIDHGIDYNVDNFYEIISVCIEAMQSSRFKSPGTSIKRLSESIDKSIDSDVLV